MKRICDPVFLDALERLLDNPSGTVSADEFRSRVLGVATHVPIVVGSQPTDPKFGVGQTVELLEDRIGHCKGDRFTISNREWSDKYGTWSYFAPNYGTALFETDITAELTKTEGKIRFREFL